MTSSKARRKRWRRTSWFKTATRSWSNSHPEDLPKNATYRKFQRTPTCPGRRGFHRHSATAERLDFRSFSVDAGGQRGGSLPLAGPVRLRSRGEDRSAASAAEHGPVLDYERFIRSH